MKGRGRWRAYVVVARRRRRRAGPPDDARRGEGARPLLPLPIPPAGGLGSSIPRRRHVSAVRGGRRWPWEAGRPALRSGGGKAMLARWGMDG